MKRYFASCPKGLEYLLRDELVALGAQAQEARAGAYFEGDLAMAYRACLWSRLASRILLPLAEFEAADEEALYAGVQAVDWSEHMAVDGTLAVDAVSTVSKLTHTKFLAQRVKDAVVDQFRDRTGERPGVDLERPSIRLNLRLYRDRATLSLDLSGAPLHRRGYRVGTGEAPIKENLAAAMLVRAGWSDVYAEGGVLVDPMCGSGTLLIEAAWMAADVAPGLRRTHFGFTDWRGHDAAAWAALHEEAQTRANAGLTQLKPVFFGYDRDPRVLQEAKRNAQEAGVAGFVQLARQSVEHLRPPGEAATPGLVICNPPYGERLGDAAEVGALYRDFGTSLRSHFAGWTAAVIVADDELGHALGLRARKRYTLFNGALECRLLLFDVNEPKPQIPHDERTLSPGAQAVANRITKNLRHLRKQAEREHTGCWRVYDSDLPEYAAAIDIYTQIHAVSAVPDSNPYKGRQPAGGAKSEPVPAPATQRWLHIQEYAAPAAIPEHTARTRLAELVTAAAQALDVPRERIALKTRLRDKGGAKYGRMDERGEFMVVEEGGLRFRVNLFDYLDSGLFLDHRPARARLREAAAGKRFLNLFCYTATASVHAAAGRAASTTSVDLSATYLDWAAQNLALNGLSGAQHALVQADSLAWLEHDQGRYDLIFVDPPTFSNSKRAADFDVQRDHVRLLKLCGERLAVGGLIVFSNNFRRFRLDSEALAGFDIRDISRATIPFDFERNPRIHQCYELRLRAT